MTCRKEASGERRHVGREAAWEEWRRWHIKRVLQHTLEASVRMQKSFHTFVAWLFRTRKGDWPACFDSVGNPMVKNPDPLSLLTCPLPSSITLALRDWALQSIQSPDKAGTTKMEPREIPQRLSYTSASYTGSWIHGWILCALQKKPKKPKTPTGLE